MKKPSGIRASDFGAIVLCGGRSDRMGFPKPWLDFNGSQTFLEHVIQVYLDAGIGTLVAVINSEFCGSTYTEPLNRITPLCAVVRNNQPEKGRLHSLRLGLEAMNSPNVFIHNVDSPQFGKQLIIDMRNQHGNSDVTTPVTERKRGHPVLIGKAVIELILAKASEFGTLRDILQLFKPNLVETEDKGILLNLNTQAQYEDWERGRTE